MEGSSTPATRYGSLCFRGLDLSFVKWFYCGFQTRSTTRLGFYVEVIPQEYLGTG